MTRLRGCALALGLVTGCAPAHVVSTIAPAPAPGSHIRYTTRSDSAHFVTGRTMAVGPDALVLERFIPGDRPRWLADSIPADSIASLQVRVGRRGNGGRGALIGALAGAAIGVVCAGENSAWVTSDQCILGYTAFGAGTGLLFGALVRSDVWAPAELPGREPARPPAPVPVPVSAAPSRIGLQVLFRLPSR